MDIWEANSNAAAFTPHPCTVVGQTRCSGADCGAGDDRYDGVCDKDGCDFNSYRQGVQSFLGPGKTIDTKSKITVVTQFITNDGTDTGSLSEIRRFYVQNGKTIANSMNTIAGIPSVNSITDSYCTAQKSVFDDTNDFATKGGLKAMGQAMARGMVLVMSLWDDHDANALWLDSTYPTDSTHLGAQRGPCGTDTGVPADVESQYPGASVTFSNIKVGSLNSTFAAGTVSPPVGGGNGGGASSSTSTRTTMRTTSTTSSRTSTTTAPAAGSVAKYGQCGGKGWTGATACVSGSTCKVVNDYYSQCQ
jgi:cellulose 1,4-beta-cellobiosidase